LLRFRDSQAHSPLRHPAGVFRMRSKQDARVLARCLHVVLVGAACRCGVTLRCDNALRGHSVG